MCYPTGCFTGPLVSRPVSRAVAPACTVGIQMLIVGFGGWQRLYWADTWFVSVWQACSCAFCGLWWSLVGYPTGGLHCVGCWLQVQVSLYVYGAETAVCVCYTL